MIKFILLFLSGMLLGILLCCLYFYQKRKRQKTQILQLCDKIDAILNGKDSVRFEEFQEGEFSILASEIYKMTIRLREQNAELLQDKKFMKESLEDISHQLRTPLTSIMLLVPALRNQELSRQERICKIQEILKLLSQMQWQIETLLKLSRLEAGAVQFRINTFSVSELIAAAVEPIAISLDLKNVEILQTIPENSMLTGDKLYLTEAILNILKNCMEHTPEYGRIQIQVSQNAIYTGIIITDSGNGIPEEAIPHIFERFYRGTELSKTGFGIGLAFARKIIASQNGSLQVRNATPHGAEFEIRLYQITEI